MADRFELWHDALEKRHMASLTFQEIRRSVQTLSSIYVERRERIDSGAVLDGAGKRAAFAMFYGPLHFLLTREIVRALGVACHTGTILDLGCGTGIAGAAWAAECVPPPRVVGIDRNAWALEESRWTYQAFGIRGTTRSADLRTLAIPPEAGVVAAFAVNELDMEAQQRLLAQFLKAAGRGAPVLIIEPIARRVAAWWDDWAAAFIAAGGRADRWKFPVELPGKLKLMDRAAGLDHRELSARSLVLNSRLA